MSHDDAGYDSKVWVEVTARVVCNGVTVEDGDRLALAKRAWVIDQEDVAEAVRLLPEAVSAAELQTMRRLALLDPTDAG
jgi:hypothetical protein